MAFLVADRVWETSTTTGTGTYTLAGAKAGYRSFSAIGNSNITFYCATDGVDWEVGRGTYTSSGTTLARTTILASSNGGSAVSWPAGTRDIFVVDPGARSFWNLASGLIKGDAAGQLSAVTITTQGEQLLDDTSFGAMRTTLGFTTSDLSAFTDPQTTDYLVAFDGTTLKIITFENYLKITDQLGILSSPNFADALIAFDADTGQVLKVTLANAVGAVMPGLSTFTDTIDGASDYTFYWDASASALRRITPNKLAGGKQTIWVPAGAMVSTTTNGAADGTTELATNDVMLKTKDYDTSTLEKAQFTVAFPKSYDGGTVTFRAYWTAASGSGGVAISVAARAFSNDDALDTAFGTAVTVTDTLITANDLHDTGESSAITIAGTPADHDLIIFEVSRAVSNGSDTLGVDMKLLGVAVYFTTDVRDDT